MEGMRLIHSGEDWAHARPPCAKDMAGFLEHNEKIVSWVQPVRPFARCPRRPGADPRGRRWLGPSRTRSPSSGSTGPTTG